MAIPQHTSLVDVVKRLVEYIHLTSQHRDEDGNRPRLQACPADPCVTWRRFVRDSGWMG